MKTAHTLVLTDRRADGIPHYHRWAPSCVCGWVAPPKRTRAEAAGEYRGHMRSQGRRRGKRTVSPRAVTPAEQVPVNGWGDDDGR